MQFLKSNIDNDWMDLCEEFPEFIFELSPYIEQWYDSYSEMSEMSPKDELCNLRYGFECGIGWKSIIREYFIGLRELIKTAKENGHDLNYKTYIFKEKFGEATDQGDFYGEDRQLYREAYLNLGNTLVNNSRTHCETCGNIGKLRQSGWIRCLCDTCKTPDQL